ncbi:protein FAM124A isoform X1 [Lepisosteus oculatus]|uniref:protein FAM124A isoform X1 n=2 Tax=Lepisosteus oculatus TaxID=7918 RepID=UPI0035F51633
MSWCSEIEKNSTEDDCVDSGAETGGSDYSPMSSASSELSSGDLQDPFLVSVHIITDPGNAKALQKAADSVLAWIHPELQLFRVSERGAWRRPKRPRPGGGAGQPSLAVILFLQEEYGEEQVLQLHRALRAPPWQFHHTEKVNGRLLPYMPCSQDFFTLAAGTPLWAVRPVHYGKEIVRFTVYCRHENFADMVRMYQLVLQRELAQRREDFCFFVVYASLDTEVQLSLKRLPRGQSPAPTESAVVEFRVQDIGRLVPLLPHPCTPISEVRWQTEDYDGNKILLQVRGSTRLSRRRHTVAQFAPAAAGPPPAPPAGCLHQGRGPVSYRSRRYHRTASRARQQHRLSQQDLPGVSGGEGSRGLSAEPAGSFWTGHRTRSLLCLPTAHDGLPDPGSRFDIDALVGAEETDVDTGRRVAGGDMSVVSAYARPPQRPPPRPRPLSASGNPLPSFGGLWCGPRPPPACSPLRDRASSPRPFSPRPPRPHSASLPPCWRPPSAADSGQGPETQDCAPGGGPAEEEEQEFFI